MDHRDGAFAKSPVQLAALGVAFDAAHPLATYKEA
jgi:hypothetical protein